MIRKLVITTVLTLASVSTNAAGKLVIVGGALADRNDSVFESFLANLGSTDRVAIVPAASGRPIKSANAFKVALNHYGVDDSRIDIIKLAVRDDRSTVVDESNWADNAFDSKQIDKIAKASAIWFTGGDQSRITATLMKDGKDTPMLTLIRQRLEEGVTIGGTSAGAAMMSSTMIAAGDSMSAFYSDTTDTHYGDESVDAGPLMVTQGIGFFDNVVIDQHFDARARLARLAKALTIAKPTIGIGIDENTGIEVDIDKGTIKALGASYVTILDASLAKQHEGNISNLTLHLLSSGDTLNLQSNALSSQGTATVGNEYSHYTDGIGSGITFANQTTAGTVVADLLDNAAVSRVQRYGFNNLRQGLKLTFEQAKHSQGYYRKDPLLGTRYSATHINLSIEKVQISLSN